MDNENNKQINEYDATLEDEKESVVSDDQLQDEILNDSGLNSFQRTIAKMSEAKWKLAQRIAGAVMGILTGVALFWNSGSKKQETGIFSVPLLIALFFALILPNIIEKQGKRRAPQLRIALVIVLAVVIVAFFLITGIRTGFNFKAQ